MTSNTARHPGLERMLSALLLYGTWLASTVIGAGLVILVMAGSGGRVAASGVPIVTIGTALLILLPVLRVILMLIVFALERDLLFSAIAALVLLIILTGLALGIRTARRTERKTQHLTQNPGPNAGPST